VPPNEPAGERGRRESDPHTSADTVSTGKLSRAGAFGGRGIDRRFRVRRQPARGHYDRATIDAVLDAGLVAHVAFVDEGHPVNVPLLYVRDGDRVYIHAASVSRAMRVLGSGVAACLAVTILDGLVLARSAFEHSANYRSVMLFGTFSPLSAHDERLRALRAITNTVVPGRWNEVRPPSERELRATTILAMNIDRASAKLRSGPPTDDNSPDNALDVWAGVVPVVTSVGEPRASPGLRSGIPIPDSVRRLSQEPRGIPSPGQTVLDMVRGRS
jgi:uncharacterized protein